MVAVAPKVLVVESESVAALDVVLMLQLAGAKAIWPATSLAQASEVARTETIDAALLDGELGKESLYPLTDALKRRGIPFAFLTALPCEDIAPPFSNVKCITKPVSPIAIKYWVAGLRLQSETQLRRFPRLVAP